MQIITSILQTAIFLLGFVPAGIVLFIFFRKVRSKKSIYIFLGLTLLSSLMCIWYVDLNIPLSESHFRTNTKVLPIALSFILVSFKYIFIGSIIFGSQALKKLDEH
jgi:hypothetical protein